MSHYCDICGVINFDRKTQEFNLIQELRDAYKFHGVSELCEKCVEPIEALTFKYYHKTIKNYAKRKDINAEKEKEISDLILKNKKDKYHGA